MLIHRALAALAAVFVATTGCDIDRVIAQPLPEPTLSDFRTQQTRQGMKFWPRSASVDLDVTYRFSTGHCGLEHLTDFDASFWEPIDPNREAKDPLFFYSEDDGTMTLVSKNTAVYRASDEQEVRLKRLSSPLLLEGACA
ncbi:hypothetical protein BH24ACT26_BH24ACT26_04900 [soil metagenome]